MLCSACLPRLERCGVCRTDLRSSPAGLAVVRRHRWAETVEGELLTLLLEEGVDFVTSWYGNHLFEQFEYFNLEDNIKRKYTTLYGKLYKLF